MTNATEWRPKVGERVAIYGTVKEQLSSNDLYRVSYPSGDYNLHHAMDLSPLPAPASSEARAPWVVLREAAKVLLGCGWLAHVQLLHDEADRLEAAAARKPTLTLAEAVRAYDEGSRAKWSDVMDALAREQSA